MVLPRQPRDIVPDVEWIVQDRFGKVHSPMGTVLGFIRRGTDGLWFAASQTNRSPVRTETRTDALISLANLMSSPVTVVSEWRSPAAQARGR